MELNRRLKRFERAAREDVHSFELRDGGTVYYDPDLFGIELFTFAVKLLTVEEYEDMPEPPEALRQVWRAADLQSVLDRFRAGGAGEAVIDITKLPASPPGSPSASDPQPT
jgi:hypothetical protein